MRKSIVTILSLTFLLTVSVFGASGQTAVADLTALASEFPADTTMVYIAVRTDDAFIDELDAVFSPVYPLIEEIPEGFDLRAGINQAIIDSDLGLTYDDLRAWLGDTAAIGLFVRPSDLEDPSFLYADDLTDNLEPVVALSITDREAVLAALQALAANDDTELDIEERGAKTVVSIPFGPTVVLSDTTMLLGESELVNGYGMVAADFSSLGSDATLGETVNMLPESGYNAMAYVNQAAYVNALQVIAESGSEFAQEDARAGLAGVRNFGGAAVGFVILNGNTFTADGVVLAGEESPARILGGVGSVDLDFAARIPANTPFVIHSTNLKAIYDAGIEAARQVQEETGEGDVDADLAEANTELEEAAGVTIDDVVGWMVNDYALILGLSEAAENATSIFGLLASNPLELGFVVDASADTAAAVALVDAFERVLNSEEVTSQLGANETTTITIAREANVISVEIIDNTQQIPFPVTLQVGVVEDVFFIGTEGLTRAVAAGDGGLTSNAAFQDAGSLLVPDSNAVYFINVEALAALVELATPMMDNEQDAETLATVFALLRHSTLSGSTAEDGSTMFRATITINN